MIVTQVINVFTDGDGAYLQWLTQHPHGFVLNTARSSSPGYMVLHRAVCPSISTYTHNARPGGFTERDYIKVCSADIEQLRVWVRQHGRPDGSFSRDCPLCSPQ